jgi:hypothetical protein
MRFQLIGYEQGAPLVEEVLDRTAGGLKQPKRLSAEAQGEQVERLLLESISELPERGVSSDSHHCIDVFHGVTGGLIFDVSLLCCFV